MGEVPLYAYNGTSAVRTLRLEGWLISVFLIQENREKKRLVSVKKTHGSDRSPLF